MTAVLLQSQLMSSSYMESDMDTIVLSKCITASIGVNFKKSINGYEYFLHIGIYFRMKLRQDTPAKIRPIVITPIENVKLYRSLHRRFAPQQKDFINATMREFRVLVLHITIQQQVDLAGKCCEKHRVQEIAFHSRPNTN